jgi:hypothetical protein
MKTAFADPVWIAVALSVVIAALFVLAGLVARMKPMKILVMATSVWVCVLFGSLIVVQSHDSPDDPSAHAEQDVIRTCQDSVRGTLKDPDSARFDGWSAWRSGLSGDALRYSASGMVNAKNGFGGYSGNEPYSCDATVTSGTVNATARTG